MKHIGLFVAAATSQPNRKQTAQETTFGEARFGAALKLQKGLVNTPNHKPAGRNHRITAASPPPELQNRQVEPRGH